MNNTRGPTMRTGMAEKDSDRAPPFRRKRVITVCEDGTSRGFAYNYHGEKVTFITPKGTTANFSKEDVLNILQKSMKAL